MRVCMRGHPQTPENLEKNGKCAECRRLLFRERYANDPEWRAKRLAHTKSRTASGRRRERDREKWANDPVWRARKVERDREYERRRMADPVRAELAREQARFASEADRRRKGVKPRQWKTTAHRKPGDPQSPGHGEVLPVAPFLEWVEAWLARHPDVTESQLFDWAGSNPRRLFEIRRGRAKSVSLSLVSRVLDAAGEPPHVLHALYPLHPIVEGDQGNLVSDGPVIPFSLDMPLFRDWTKRCGAGECRADSGYGFKERFCPEHAKLMDKLREDLAMEGGFYLGAGFRDDSMAYE